MSARKTRRIGIGPRAQRGIIGLVSLMFILVVVLFALRQTGTIAASNLMDSSRQSDAVEALFLAESAVERVGFIFVNDSTHTCTDAAIGTGTDYSLGRGVFRVVQTFTTNFSGASLPATMCRVRVQGEITSNHVKRTVDAIVGTTDDVISISSLNPNLNDVPWEGSRTQDEFHAPTSWSLTASSAGTGSMKFIPWDHLGGNDDDNINGVCKTTGDYCDRGLFLRKTDTGLGTASAGGAFNTSGTPITVNVPSTGSKTLRLTFDFRVWGRAGSSARMYFGPKLVFDIGSFVPSSATAAGGDCSPTSGATLCESDRTYTATAAAWSGSYGVGCGYTDTPCFESGPSDATCPTYNPTSSYIGVTGTAAGQKAGTYAQCSDPSNRPPQGTTGYKTGYLTYVISCTGGCTATLQSLSMVRSDLGSGSGFYGKPGGINWIWVDNLRLSVPALSGGGPAKIWREVAAP